MITIQLIKSRRPFAHCPAGPSAFTLIELLVVIAIILFLTVILFPVFSTARENARRSTCQSNLHQVAIGIGQYAQDNDEQLPRGRDYDPANNSSIIGFRGQGWGGPVYPYVQSSQVFTCPDDWIPLNGNPTISYAFNSALVFDQTGNGINYNGVPIISRFTAPAHTVLFTEISNVTWNPAVDQTTAYSPGVCGFDGWPNSVPGTARYATGLFAGVTQQSASNTKYPIPAIGRHLDGANFAFLDGHVKWLNASGVSPGLAAPSPASASPGNNYPYNAAGTGVAGFEATFSPI